ncbi:glycosyltransferase [Hydrocarboniphaga effusa]|uniref:glycosyltransferase n=1 Tax=Hydrocarboniphaga effusa TaxID=243629 RepID=UPI003BAC8B2A
MRIAFILNNLSGGGAERVAVNVANNLAQLGNDVSLVLNYKRGPYIGDVSPNVTILSLEKRMLFALPRLVGVLRREKFDAVLSVLDQPSMACLLVKPLVSHTKFIVIECNNPLASNDGVRSFIWKLIRKLRPLLYPKADHIITKSEGIRSALLKHFNCKSNRVTAIANPVDTARIDRLALEEVNHPWFSSKVSAPVIVAMGRLSIQKGFDNLINAFTILRKERNLRLLILGEGSERSHLEALVRKLNVTADVDLHGFSTNPYAYVARANCFVLSSRWEGWPNALVEALACGTSSVATDWESGPSEILSHGTYGSLVPPENVLALASAIKDTLDSPKSSHELRAHVLQFSPRIVAQKYLSVIEGAIANGH